MTAQPAQRRAPSAGLVDRMAETWRAPRAGVAREIASAEEARLLFYAFAASALFTMAALGAQNLNPSPEVARDFGQWATTQVVVGTFVRPLGLYGAAALIGLACRAFGGRGGWRATRAAVFWTALVAAPAGVMLTLIGAAATGLGGAPALAATLGHAAGSALWAVLLAPALAQAHGFRSGMAVFGVFCALGLCVAALAALA